MRTCDPAGPNGPTLEKFPAGDMLMQTGMWDYLECIYRSRSNCDNCIRGHNSSSDTRTSVAVTMLYALFTTSRQIRCHYESNGER